MGRRVVSGEARREGFVYIVVKGIIVLRKGVNLDVGLRFFFDRIVGVGWVLGWRGIEFWVGVWGGFLGSWEVVSECMGSGFLVFCLVVECLGWELFV